MSNYNMINKHGVGTKIAVYGIFIIFLMMTVYPLFWLTYSSLKTRQEISAVPLAFPEVPQFKNYPTAFLEGGLYKGFINSSIYLVGTLALTITSSMMCSYAFSKLGYKKLSKFLKGFIGMGILLSIHAVMIPLFMLLRSLGLYGTRIGIIFTYTAISIPMAVFIGTEYMNGLPNSLIESAQIDGAHRFTIFSRIILPMTKPVMVTMGIMTALTAWNEFLLGYLFSKRLTIPLPAMIMSYSDPKTPAYELQFAALIMSLLPMAILYSIFNKHITKGVVGGAIKG